MGIISVFVAVFVFGAVAVYADEVNTHDEAAAILEVAIENFMDEVLQRLGTSPLAAFAVLGDALYDGGVVEINLAVDTGNILAPVVGSNITIYSQMEQKLQFAFLELYVQLFGMDIPLLDMEIHQDGTRYAFGSPLLGEGLFGFDTDTIAEDFTTFAQLVGMNEYDIEMLAFILSVYDLEARFFTPDFGIFDGGVLSLERDVEIWMNGQDIAVDWIWFELEGAQFDFYVDKNGRLVAMDIHDRFDEVWMSFGNDVLDIWTFEMYSLYDNVIIEWGIYADGDWVVNSFSVNDGFDTFYFDIQWDTYNGTVFFVDDFGDVVLDAYFILGDGFVFETIIDELWLRIAATPQEMVFDELVFVNIDQWGQNFLDRLEEALDTLEALFSIFN